MAGNAAGSAADAGGSSITARIGIVSSMASSCKSRLGEIGMVSSMFKYPSLEFLFADIGMVSS